MSLHASSDRRAEVTRIDDVTARIERVFDAPRAVVFDTMLDPELIPQWWGPAHHETRVERMDACTGGGWRFVSRDADGTEYGFEGEYREIAPHDRVVQTFTFDGAPGHVSVETAVFEDLDGGHRTKMTVTAVHDDAAALQGMLDSGMEGGMNETYQRLDALLAAHAAG